MEIPAVRDAAITISLDAQQGIGLAQHLDHFEGVTSPVHELVVASYC